MKTVICLSAWMALTLAVRAGVYDDTAVWWHLDYDPDYVDGAVNVVQFEDFRDQRNWAATSGPGYPTQILGTFGGPVWTNASVVCPAGGQAYGNLSLHLRQIDDPAFVPDVVRFENLSLVGSATLVMRLRWDGIHLHQDKLSWTYNHSLDWNASCGWAFGVANNNFLVYLGRAGINGVTLESNKWTDVAVVITDNGGDDLVEFYAWTEGGALRYSRHVTNAAIVNLNGTVGILGSETIGGGNSKKAFMGMINHFALWNRALSRDEVMEALCFPQPLIQIGINDGSALDMRLESEAGTVFTAGDPWHLMPRSVSADSRSVTLNVPVIGVKTNCNYVFHLKSASCEGGASAKLLLSVNGQANTAREAQRIYPGQDYFWPVAKERLVDGINTFTLTYVNGPATGVLFDWLELGGAWQIGYDDGKKAEFSPENAAGDDFYITDPDWKHVESALAHHSSMDTNTVLHFALSPELATNTNLRFSYTTRIIEQGRGAESDSPPLPYPFSISVNGAILCQTNGVPNGTLVNIPLDATTLRAGMNNINLMLETVELGNWIQFDFHRFEPTMWELPDISGTTLLVQ